MTNRLLFLFVSLLISGCGNKHESKTAPQDFSATNEAFRYSGRTEKMGDSAVALISSASFVSTKAEGDSITLYLESPDANHAYVALEVNNDYKGRFKVDGEPLKIALSDSVQRNEISIYKATEASSGDVLFKGVKAENITAPEITEEKPMIDFIGNSITCGMWAQTDDIPCGEGEWYDQHNAYLAYGPRVARALDADFRLSCVSGMGMYRNWNDEDQPVMPDVYENLRLNGDDSKKADLSEAPDVVSIALGTNDLSEGDGEKERNEFSKEKYVKRYIGFVQHIFELYPHTKVALLSSPMITGEKNEILTDCLDQVKNHFEDKDIRVFHFENIEIHGCGGHPSVEDNQKMAEQLIPFFKNILNQ
ncbi:MAG: GDSL-type esterase/lipase family protein [Salegentibacter sp.]